MKTSFSGFTVRHLADRDKPPNFGNAGNRDKTLDIGLGGSVKGQI